jgi:hypothetical protein
MSKIEKITMNVGSYNGKKVKIVYNQSNEIKEENKFKQLCVWEGTVVPEKDIQDFIQWFLTDFHIRIQYKCQVETLENKDGPGGRIDCFFYIHDDDISKFAIVKFKIGARWWEDINYNKQQNIYPAEFVKENPFKW